MRNFSWVGISKTGVLFLAAVGCSSPAPHLVDAAHGVDTGPIGVDTNPMSPDTNMMPVDANVHPDTGSGAMCSSFGGGCDLFAHDCPMMGTTRQGCYAGATMTQCAPAGTAQVGDACTNANDCDDGLICLNTGTTGTCAHACCSATDCMAGEMCNMLGGLPTGVTTGYCSRPTACTPVPNSGCATMQQCVMIASDGTTDCQPTGTAAEGATCGGTTGVACVEGTGCYGPAGGTSMCSRICRIAMGNADCTGTATTCGSVGLGSTYGLCH